MIVETFIFQKISSGSKKKDSGFIYSLDIHITSILFVIIVSIFGRNPLVFLLN